MKYGVSGLGTFGSQGWGYNGAGHSPLLRPPVVIQRVRKEFAAMVTYLTETYLVVR
jgi:hypothetical protein